MGIGVPPIQRHIVWSVGLLQYIAALHKALGTGTPCVLSQAAYRGGEWGSCCTPPHCCGPWTLGLLLYHHTAGSRDRGKYSPCAHSMGHWVVGPSRQTA